MTDSEPRAKSLLAVLLGAVDRHVKQRPRDTIVRNAVDDPAEVYARRVTENDACDFCSRFANDTPVDPSRVSEKFHQFCKCHFMLFFQETKYRDRIVSDEELKKVGIVMDPGANPDYYEKRDAMVLAALGRKVRFLKSHPSGARRADTLIDGELVEFKNPTGNSIFTVQRQIKNNLYGRDTSVINPQSDVLLISNVRNSMTMTDMQKSLVYAFGEDGLLTAEEKAYMRKIVLLDERTRRIRVYEMKKPTLRGSGPRRRQNDISIAGRGMQSGGSARSGDRFLRTEGQSGLLGYGMRKHPEKYDARGLDIEVDEMVPCLRRLSDNKIVKTEVAQVPRSELGKFTKRKGWFIDWAKVPNDVTVYMVSVEGSSEPEGLVGIKNDPDNAAVYVHWGVAAPHNQAQLVGKSKKRYNGVGGHLIAIAADESMKMGYNGFIYGKAANLDLLDYYRREFGAIQIGSTYNFYIDESKARDILDKYTWTEKQ